MVSNPPLFASLLIAVLSGAPSSAPVPSPAHAPVAADPGEPGVMTRYLVAPEGNEARYRVREQLAGVSFPNDAVGATSAISGELVVDDNGRVQSGASRITVELAGLTSDRDRRDNFIRTRTLETEQHPTAALVPIEFRGLTWPLPASGTVTFELVGNLTVKGVTRSTTWNVTLTVAGDTLSGTAATSFSFADFALTKPRVAVVLSVDDTIRLEYDLRLIRG